jgi:hypothetical protein
MNQHSSAKRTCFGSDLAMVSHRVIVTSLT